MKTLVERYRRLLDANETQRNLADALRLVDDLVALARRSGPDGARTNGRAGRVRQSEAESAHVAEEFKRLGRDAVSPAVLRLCQRTAEALLVAPQIAENLNLDLRQASLLLDACQLVFHHAQCALLPKVEETGLALSRALLNVMAGFAEGLNDPADRAHLLGRCYESLGEWERAAACHAAAVRATPSSEPNFMTLLQIHWMFLLDRSRMSDALDVLLEAYPRVCRTDLDEMAELIRTTFEIQARDGEPVAVT